MKQSVKYAVQHMKGLKIKTIKNLADYQSAKALAEKYEGYVYLQPSERSITKRIWPKEEPRITWEDINDMLCYAAGIIKLPRPSMFSYVITVIAGEYDTWIEYTGDDREEALAAMHRCNEKDLYYTCKVETCWKHV